MSERQNAEIDQLLERCHESHGHRLALMRQHVGNGDMKAAALMRGQAQAYETVLYALKELQRTGELTDTEPRSEYVDISKAMIAADESRRQETEDDTDSIGVQ